MEVGNLGRLKYSVAICCLWMATSGYSGLGVASTPVSASASAKITLRISPRARVEVEKEAKSAIFCVAGVPANRYQIVVRESGAAQRASRLVEGQKGRYCIADVAYEQVGLIIIMAQ